MPGPPDLRVTLLAAWWTNNRVTIDLVHHLPSELWEVAVPGVPQRTIRMMAAHLHNARCRWAKTLGREHGIAAPARVDHHRVARRELVAALKRSGDGIEGLLELGLATEGHVPPSGGTYGATYPSTSVMCSPTSWRMMLITVDRSSWWPAKPATGCRGRSQTGCGNGRRAPRTGRGDA